VRDLKGALRPVHGVSGAFVLGEALLLDIGAAAFRGSYGCAQTAAGLLVVRDGKVAENASADECPLAQDEISIEDDEVVIFDTGVRLRVPERIESIEPVAEGWYAIRSQKTLFLLRSKTGNEAIYTLPEAAS
jgi:hypothetical protein